MKNKRRFILSGIEKTTDKNNKPIFIRRYWDKLQQRTVRANPWAKQSHAE
jgi:hypothetical protein